MFKLAKKYNNRISLFLVILFLCGITLRYPLLFVYPFPGGVKASVFYAIDLSVIGAFSLFFVLLKIDCFFVKTKKYLIFSSFIMFVLVAIQFFYYDNQTFREFCFSLSWLIIPLAVYLYADFFLKALFPYFSFIFIFNLIYLINEIYYNREFRGLAGNRNWHAALILGITPLIIYKFYLLMRDRSIPKKYIYIFSAIVTFFSFVVLLQCFSRGANVALIGTLVILFFCFIKNKTEKYKRIIILSILTIIVCLSLSVLLYGDKVAEMIRIDVRPPLWEGALGLFKDKFLLGTGSPGFESNFAFHIPIARFLKSWYYVDRANHPHNHLLYMAASFGIIGLFCYFFFWFYPIIYCIKKYKDLSTQYKVILFSFIALSIHAMFDLIFFEWPTVFIAFIFQGILWRKVYYIEKPEIIESSNTNISSLQIISKSLTAILSLLLIIEVIQMTYENMVDSSRLRNGMIEYEMNNKPYSLWYLDSSNNPEAMYKAGILSLIDFNDHLLALKYFKRLEKHPAKIIAHANSHIANCYIKLNRKREALHYINLETRSSPISIPAHYNKMLLERELNDKIGADRTKSRLQWIIKIKGLSQKNVKKILKNPELDGRYYLLKKKN